MAEERLIDDDKDRKYKIRRNEDGEEELVIDDEPEEEEKPDEVEFEVPELMEDDEEAAVMTPEQLAARDKAREEAEQKRLKALAEHIELAEKLIAEERYDDCVYVLDEALTLDKRSGEVYALRMIALTKNFNDVDARIGEAIAAAEGFLNFVTPENKEKYAYLNESAKKLYAPLKERADELTVQNEEAKGARRENFKKKQKNSGIAFAATGIPFVIFAIIAIYFSTVMYARKDGQNMVLFFVFLGIAVVFFIATLFTAHKFWDCTKLVSLNEKNSSSKLGRECDEKNAELKFIEKIIAAFEKPVETADDSEQPVISEPSDGNEQ